MMPSDSLKRASEQIFNVSCLVGSLKALADGHPSEHVPPLDCALLLGTFGIINKQLLEAYVTVSDYDAQLKADIATEPTAEGGKS